MSNLWIFVAVSCLLIGQILSQTMSFEEAEKSPNCICDGKYCRCVRYRHKSSNGTEGSNTYDQGTGVAEKYQTKNTGKNTKSRENEQDLNSIDDSSNYPAPPPPPPPVPSLQVPQNNIYNGNSQSNTGAFTDKFALYQPKPQNSGFQLQQQPQFQQQYSYLPPLPNYGQRNYGAGAVAASSSSGGRSSAIAGANAGNANAGAFASAGAGSFGNPFVRRNIFFPFGKKR